MNNGPINAVLQHIRHLAAIEEFREQTDSWLLERFLATKEEAAFGALLHRHGALVWRVCQRVLRHRQDAEDVFQATFLTLARKAGSIRKQASVASWLHGVAYRLARRVQAELARQRRLADKPAAAADGDGADQCGARELQSLLDEELAALKESHRVPLVLCYLEGKTADEAAQQLGWSLRTLMRRLQEGRKLLAGRLSRRGVSLGVAALSAGLLQSAARAAVPPALVGPTCMAAALVAAGKSARGIVSGHVAAITNAMVRSMFVRKLKMSAAAILALVVALGGAALWASRPAEKDGQDQPIAARGPEDQQEHQGEDERRPGRNAKMADQPKADPAALVKRGEYLVNLAHCADCHTPRRKTGELDMSKHLQGAPAWFTPKIRPKGDVAERSCDITMSGRAGSWSTAKMVKFLSTGGKAEFPMPQYNMSADDAVAVSAYLRSLPGRQKDAKSRVDDD